MVRRRDFLGPWLGALFIAALVATGLPPGPARADEFGAGAKKFIEILTSDAISMLTVEDISKTERADRFRRLMNENFAIKGIAKFVLGRHWRKATESEKKEYLQLFENLLVATYADRFSSFSGESFEITGVKTGPRETILVNTRINRRNDTPVAITYVVKRFAGVARIVDVVVEGISMGITQRAEFASVIRNRGGKVAGLLTALREKTGKN